MKLNEVTDVFFDLDHTLWDFERNSALAFNEIFNKQKLDLNLDDFMKVYKPINFRYWELYRNNSVTKEALRFGRLKESFDALQFEACDATINLIANDYIEYLPKNNHLLEGSKELLTNLHKRYKLHIITNGFEEVQHLKMRNSGIQEYFSTVTTSEEAGVKKPHPQIFEKALIKSSAVAQNSVMIGDNLEADIVGASKFGFHVIYLNPDREVGQHQFAEIQKLKEVLNYL
ncbi:YjjG family noncanonical pyrimidine nucleotidase [Gramella sp. GC03-9]|uniref:YjjG family noncanonical pyrimidine nucleotidase n=1 Tax=Christiangramia oceanisediminis TaxID=2920386 RepID=A0A9X2L0G1_9FLAO|nr:YjjG family noncanonical pyrimidine nucleotidase [Gramella oceanisediminis]MCP9201559.1 YjjG family noncanonical pyrimidine nucleotidase [Gramella oceanisediminis]